MLMDLVRKGRRVVKEVVSGEVEVTPSGNRRLDLAREEILKELRPLIARARRDGLVLHLPVQSRTFTPDALEAEIRQGRFIWGPKWWRAQEVRP